MRSGNFGLSVLPWSLPFEGGGFRALALLGFFVLGVLFLLRDAVEAGLLEGFEDVAGDEIAFDRELVLLRLDGARLHAVDFADGFLDGLGAGRAAVVDA